ncbi:MAG: PQQ-dependent sugar dehydrogenase [Candidatus Moranbacteria bacterium]|nr:PQQ-dependent sugar dehydrogenase [Candidatus Moranbacteria bacterium]
MKFVFSSRRLFVAVSLLIILVGLVFVGVRLWRGVKPAVVFSPVSVEDVFKREADAPKSSQGGAVLDASVNNTDFPFVLPDGFSFSLFATGLDSPRDLVFDSEGNLLVSEFDAGRVVVFSPEGKRSKLIEGLEKPHGLLLRCEDGCQLFVVEERRLWVYDYQPNSLHVSRGRVIADLPRGGRHTIRSLETVSDDGRERLLVSVGSTCDTCVENNERAGSVLIMDFDGKNVEIFSRGLRNAVFLARHPNTGDVWVTEMGRDKLGDDLPPDEINILRRFGHYGWPWCYGDRVHDVVFDLSGQKTDFCSITIGSHIALPAHVAPLGLVFVPSGVWGQEYDDDLLVAYHGSWNRSDPVGYKIVRFRLDESGFSEGGFFLEEDFLSGWLNEDGTSFGRPVDVVFSSDGGLFISDDKVGVIYRLDRAL